MRVFETAHDHCAIPGLHLVGRVDGRSFTRLTKDVCEFERPYDVRFRDLMLDTAEHLMTACGFRIVYGYTQSDEISLLFHRDENAFGRKLRKFVSILAGEASARFSLALGKHAAFDARVSLLPDLERVVDYFRWRSEDAHRNSIGSHCYWRLREEGLGGKEAADRLRGMSLADKNEFLFQRGVNYDDLPAWQKRGSGVVWIVEREPSVDRRTGEPASRERRRVRRELDLPRGEAYDRFVLDRLA